MYFVYCLISLKSSKFHYYGFTEDIEKRLQYHEKGKVRTTNRFLPIELLGYKEFESREEALKFEKDLKSKSSFRKRFIRELTQESGSPA